MSSSLAAKIFERFIARSGFAGGYHWSSLKKKPATENSAVEQNLLPATTATLERFYEIPERCR